MRLNYGEGNGVRLAGRTSLNTARIAHTARKALSTLIYNILRGRYRPQLPTAGGSRSTATSIPTADQTRVNPTFCRSFFCLNPDAVDAGDVFTSFT